MSDHFFHGRPKFSRKRAMRYLGLKDTGRDWSALADMMCKDLGRKIYEDSERPEGEGKLKDYGKTCEIYLAWLALGSK